MLTGSGRTAFGAVAGAVALALAGCSSSSHASVPIAKKAMIARACKQHRMAAAVVVGGIVDYKTYMTSEDPAFQLTFAKSGIAGKVASAIKTLEAASGPGAATSAGQSFFNDLDRLDSWLRKPAAVPSAVIGDRNVSKVEGAGRAVGCPL